MVTDMKQFTACLAAALLLSALTGCQSQAAPAPELLEPVGVKMDTAQVQYGDIYNISVYNGQVMPYVEELSFPVDGRLEEINAAIGETVQQGQVLARLDDEETRRRIKELESEIAYTTRCGELSDRQREADIGIAREELAILEENVESTYQARHAKEIEITQLETVLAQEQELRRLSLENLNAQLSQQQSQLDGTVLTAPFSGKVVYVSQAKKGDSIGGFETVICIADESRLHISSDYIAEYVISGANEIYAAIEGREYAVTFAPMDVSEYLSLVLSGGELNTVFSFQQPDETLESGQYAAVTILDSREENVLLVPSNALYRDEKGRYVYKIVDGARIRQDVTVGISNNLEAQIIEGLQEGDVVYVKE